MIMAAQCLRMLNDISVGDDDSRSIFLADEKDKRRFSLTPDLRTNVIGDNQRLESILKSVDRSWNLEISQKQLSFLAPVNSPDS